MQDELYVAVDLHVVHILYVFLSQFFSELPPITLSLQAHFAFILSAFRPEFTSSSNIIFCEMFINTQG